MGGPVGDLAELAVTDQPLQGVIYNRGEVLPAGLARRPPDLLQHHQRVVGVLTRLRLALLVPGRTPPGGGSASMVAGPPGRVVATNESSSWPSSTFPALAYPLAYFFTISRRATPHSQGQGTPTATRTSSCEASTEAPGHFL